jgi:hypothetical protein
MNEEAKTTGATTSRSCAASSSGATSAKRSPRMPSEVKEYAAGVNAATTRTKA